MPNEEQDAPDKTERKFSERFRPRNSQLPDPVRRTVDHSVPQEDRNPHPIIDTTSPLASRLGPRSKFLRLIMPGPSGDIYRSYLEGGVDAIGVSTIPFDARTVKQLEKSISRITRSVEKSPYAMLVTSPDDLKTAHEQGKLGVFLCNQGASGYDDPPFRGGVLGSILDRMQFLSFISQPRPGNPDDLADLREQGLMVTGIAYNKINRLGAGIKDAENTRGLTDLGRSHIRAAMEAGMAIDLCHLNERTALEAAAFITAELEMPPLISHVDCYDLCDIPRNATGKDSVLRAVAEGNGVVGVSALFYSMSKPGELNNTIDRVMEHIDHIVQVAGVDHAGLGLDYWTGIAPYNPGVVQDVRDWWEVEVRKLYEDRSMFHPGTDKMAPGLETPSGIHNLVEAIREHFSVENGYEPDAADKILGGNMQRVLNMWWKGRERGDVNETEGYGNALDGQQKPWGNRMRDEENGRGGWERRS